jgi:hypoxanthine phosphoribosyltransferase
MAAEEISITQPHRQLQLPLPWAFARPNVTPVFAHPAEAKMARILSFYRIRWLYEPTTFVLRTGPDGRPSESFTPDFYLPEQRLYIELTTMRQPLVTRKNRKLRRLRELYPGVQIRLLYRRDVERLLGAYEESWRAPAKARVGVVVASAPDVAKRAGELADEIAGWNSPESTTSDARPIELIGLAPGALVFQQQIASALRERGVSPGVDRVSVTRFRTLSGQQRVRLVSGPRRSFAGKDVLVVADVVSTGLSIAYLVNWLRRRGARRVEVCAFFDRSSARLIDLPVRFIGFDAPDEPLVGCGIGLRSEHTRLPFVATLIPALDEVDFEASQLES